MTRPENVVGFTRIIFWNCEVKAAIRRQRGSMDMEMGLTIHHVVTDTVQCSIPPPSEKETKNIVSSALPISPTSLSDELD